MNTLNLDAEPKLDDQLVPIRVGDLKAIMSAIQALDTGIVTARAAPQLFHKVRGTTYAEVGTVTVQCDTVIHDMDELVLYRSDEDGSFFARSRKEIDDGRFRLYNHERLETDDLMRASVTVGGGHLVFGSIEALGRVQTALLAPSKAEGEETSINYALMNRLEKAEALNTALREKLRQMANIMAGTE